MEEILRFTIGIIVLVFGYFIGNFIAKITKEELSKGRPWFKLIILSGLIGALISLIYRNDILLFTFLFIVIVTSRSLKR